MTREGYMQEAISLALKGSFNVHPNPKVGCILVKNNEIIGKGYHKEYGGHHAEVNAFKYCIKKYGKAKATKLLFGSTAYITLEPCSIFSKTPPCTSSLIKYGIKNVFCASLDPNKKINGNGVKILKENGINVEVGLLEKQAISINHDFFFRHKEGRPFIRMKIAQSLDAKIALSNGESKWITSKKSRDDVQQIRLACDAILVGSGTILKDNPRLDVRKNIRNLNERQPKKIVLGSSFLKRQNDIKILKGTAEVIVFSKEFSSYAKEGNLIQIPIKKSTTLQDTLKELGKHELNSILVEGGSKIFTSFIQEDLVDELILYISPRILGKESIDSISIEPPIILSGAKKFKIYDSMLVGDDIKIIMRKKNKYK